MSSLNNELLELFKPKELTDNSQITLAPKTVLPLKVFYKRDNKEMKQFI